MTMNSRAFCLALLWTTTLGACELLGLGEKQSSLLTTADPITNTEVIQVPTDQPTIQAAIDAANFGDIVLVSAGVYNEAIRMKKGIRLIGAGYEQTFINGGSWITTDENTAAAAAVSVPFGAIQNTVIEGFTITNRFDGLFIANASPIIRNCRIAGNKRNNISIAGGSATLENVLVIGRPVAPEGLPPLGGLTSQAGIEIWENGSPEIINTTIVEHSGPGICWLQRAIVEATNIIVANNGQGLLAMDGTGHTSLTNSNVFGNGQNYVDTVDQTAENGNISADPLFAADGSFQLQAASPSKRDPNDAGIDMGTFGNRPLAWIRSRIVPNETVPSPLPSRRDLVLSFEIPEDDPDRDRFFSRSFTFDNALAAIVLTIEGDQILARRILARLAALQNADGSFNKSFNTADTFVDGSRPTGNVAWAGYAFAIYQRITNDASFEDDAREVADYLISLDVDNFAFGSIPVSPISLDRYITEHNVHASFFFEELGFLTGDSKYLDAAQRVRDNLVNEHFATDEFLTTVGDIAPENFASDANVLGALAFHAVGLDAEAQSALWSNDIRFGNAQRVPNGLEIGGHAPRPVPSDDTPHPNKSIWVETTLGAGLGWKRTGNFPRSEHIRLDMQALLSDNRGMRSSFPLHSFSDDFIFEDDTFSEWPNVAATAWFLLLQSDPPEFYRQVP